MVKYTIDKPPLLIPYRGNTLGGGEFEEQYWLMKYGAEELAYRCSSADRPEVIEAINRNNKKEVDNMQEKDNHFFNVGDLVMRKFRISDDDTYGSCAELIEEREDIRRELLQQDVNPNYIPFKIEMDPDSNTFTITPDNDFFKNVYAGSLECGQSELGDFVYSHSNVAHDNSISARLWNFVVEFFDADITVYRVKDVLLSATKANSRSYELCVIEGPSDCDEDNSEQETALAKEDNLISCNEFLIAYQVAFEKLKEKIYKLQIKI